MLISIKSLMLRQNHSSVISILLLLFVVFFSSCKDDVVVDGNSPLNNGQLVEFAFSDSFEINSYTERESMDISSGNISISTLGSLTDPRTGKTKNSVYFEVVPSLVNFTLGNNPVLDSLVLNIKYQSIYGINTIPHDISVYRMTQPINDDITYYTNDNFSISTKLGEINQVFNDIDVNDILSIPMNVSFGQELLAQFGTSIMESDTNFIDYLSGLFLVPENDNGDALAVLDLQSNDSQLRFYYSNDDTSGLSFDFEITNRVNHYDIDEIGSEAEQSLIDNANQDSIIYLAPFGGLKSIIELPDLGFLEGKLINRAQLVFKQVDYQSTTDVNFPVPNSIFLYEFTSNDSLTNLTDFEENLGISFGGFVEEITENSVTTNQYTFSITRHIQRLLNGDISNKNLCLTYFPGNRHLPGSVKLGGANKENLGITLRVIYSN